MLCPDKPPELEGAANSLLTTVEILTVDEVNTFNMEVGLTFRVGIRWTDPRLNYSNILARPYSGASLVRVLGTAAHCSLHCTVVQTAAGTRSGCPPPASSTTTRCWAPRCWP